MEKLKEVIKHLQDIIDIVEIDLTEDIEKLKFVEKQLEAINYAHSSIKLEEKKEISFEDWLILNDYEDYGTGYYGKGDLVYDYKTLLKEYTKEKLNL